MSDRDAIPQQGIAGRHRRGCPPIRGHLPTLRRNAEKHMTWGYLRPYNYDYNDYNCNGYNRIMAFRHGSISLISCSAQMRTATIQWQQSARLPRAWPPFTGPTANLILWRPRMQSLRSFPAWGLVSALNTSAAPLPASFFSFSSLPHLFFLCGSLFLLGQ